MTSPEHRAILKNLNSLCDNISTAATSVWFAQSLAEKGFIGSQVQNKALRTGVSEYEKVAELLAPVRAQIESNPSRLYDLIEILSKEPALQLSVTSLKSCMAGGANEVRDEDPIPSTSNHALSEIDSTTTRKRRLTGDSQTAGRSEHPRPVRLASQSSVDSTLHSSTLCVVFIFTLTCILVTLILTYFLGNVLKYIL